MTAEKLPRDNFTDKKCDDSCSEVGTHFLTCCAKSSAKQSTLTAEKMKTDTVQN